MSLSPGVALLYILTTGVGAAMMIGGLRMRALVRRSVRRCPACGRQLRSREACRCSTR
jgi:hypothetical protein